MSGDPSPSALLVALRRVPDTLYDAAAAAICVAMHLVGTAGHGLDVTPDSVHYLATAHSLAADGSFTTYDGTPYLGWPPLYPLLMAVPGLFGMDALVAARVLNGVALAGVVLIGARLFRGWIAAPPLAMAATALLAVGFPLHFVAGKVWSEPLFVLLALLSLLFLVRYVRGGTSADVTAAGVMIALAMLQRTVGVSLAATGLVTVLLVAPAIDLKRRLRDAAIFAFLAGAPTLVWVWRTLGVSGTATGERGESAFSLVDNGYLLGRVVTGWFVPGRLHGLETVVVTLLLGTVVVAVVAGARRSGLLPAREDGREIAVAWLFAAAYGLVVVVAAVTVNLDRLDDRLLVPLYPMALLALFVGLDRSASLLAHLGVGDWKRSALVGIGVLLLAATPAVQGVKSVTGRMIDEHHDYRSSRWSRSEVMSRLGALPSDRLLFSNRPDAIYVQTGRAASLSPMRTLYNSEAAPSDDLTLRLDGEIADRGSAYLVWFAGADRAWLHSLDELREMYRIDDVARLDDGSILTVARRSNQDAGEPPARGPIPAPE